MHDYIIIRKLKLTRENFLAMDRVYTDYKVFQKLTKDDRCYVKKIKKNMHNK